MDEYLQVGIGRLRLSQRRFGDGALYVSTLMHARNLIAFDFRFFVEDERGLIPTKSGFRVPAANSAALKKLFGCRPEKVVETTLSKIKDRKLIARRVNDNYGVGIDIRYRKQSARYDGWEKRGLRLVDCDFAELARFLNSTGVFAPDYRPRGDVFHGKRWVTEEQACQVHGKAQPQVRAARRPIHSDWTPVGSVLKAFLSEAE
jgi:hypothetical protein